MAELNISLEDVSFKVGDKVCILSEEAISENTQTYKFDRLSYDSYEKFRKDQYLKVVGMSVRKISSEIKIIDVNVEQQSNGNKMSLYYPLELEVFQPYAVELI